MKRRMMSMAVALGAMLTFGAYAGTPISADKLPKAAQTFLAKYFKGDSVRKAETDEGRRGIEYEVDLVSGAEVDFNSDGNWKKVEAAKGKAVPAGIVPAGIAKYVSTNHSGVAIKEIQRKRGGYEVELTNGVELHLTEDGKVMQPRTGGGNHGNRPR
jgi:hypothetical protein